jgi:hypothetical protein
MTTILNTQTASFDFYDEFNPSNKTHYNIAIKVNLLKYEDQKQFYEISYTYNLEKADKTCSESSYIHIHPFYENGSISESADGANIFFIIFDIFKKLKFFKYVKDYKDLFYRKCV